MRNVEYTIKVKVPMADASEQVIKGTGITLANHLNNALDHDANSEHVSVSGVSGSVTLDFDCLEVI